MILVLILIAYFSLGIICSKLLGWIIKTTNPIIRIGIFSFFYAFYFGIGIAGTGGEPGFAFPCPIILVGFLTNSERIVYSVLIPLLFWWVVIFLLMLLKHQLKKRKTTKQ